MANVKISYTAPGADVVTADVDGSPIAFSGTAKAGNAQVNVAGGKHRVHYIVEGQPSSSYTFKIDPPGVSVTDTIGKTGKAAGAIPFTVAQPGAAANAEKATKKPATAKKQPAEKKAPRKAANKKATGPAKKGGGR